MLPQVAYNIVDKVSDLGLKDNYESVVKKKTENQGDKIVGGFKSTNPTDTFQEFGTGIVGSENPHVNPFLEKSGWKYDVNAHGEKGWVYPTNGGFKWTKGQPAKKKFYNATRRCEKEIGTIGAEEIQKAIRRLRKG